LLFHLSGYGGGHYALIFGLREVRTCGADGAARGDADGPGRRGGRKRSDASTLRRDVFTCSYGQKPKHWVSLDRVYNMLVHLKFTGYAITKLEPGGKSKRR